MSTQAAILAGAGVGLGLTLLVRGLMPARPDLRAALARLDTGTNPPPTTRAGPPAGGRRRLVEHLVPTRLLAQVATWPLVRIPARDLELLGQTTQRFVATKLAMALLGLAVLPAFNLAISLGGLTLPFPVTVAASLAAAGLFFALPDLDVRRRAAGARDEFRRAIGLYLILVALERKADSAPHQALIGAAEAGDSWTFTRIRDALDRAHLDRRPAWDGLTRLADQLGVPDLADVADIIRGAGQEGTAVYHTLLARARALRVELAARHQTQANTDSERMVIPVALLGLAFIALLAYPVFARIAFGP